MLEPLASVLLFTLAGLVTLFVLYYLVIGCLYFTVPEKPARLSGFLKRFAVVIPAHNEGVMIRAALESWKRVQYPRVLFEIYVIADNCTDNTAEIARTHGALCLERLDANKGKGQALAWALQRLPLHEYDAVVFVDADCTVSAEFLAVMSERLIGGAKVIQGFDGILNPDDSMITRLMLITNIMKNLLLSHSKSKLGLTVQLMGTGMCFDRAILQQIAWKAFSVGEDLEQFAYLAEAGIQVEFEPRAAVYAQEATSLRQAYSQRVRWASSRMHVFGLGLRLLMKGLQQGDLRSADAAMNLLAPNYSMLANITAMGLAGCVAIQFPGRSFLIAWFVILVCAEVLYFVMGMAVSKLSSKIVFSLCFAPVFLIWKMGIDIIAVLSLRRSLWIRTPRTPHTNKQ